MNTTYYKKVDKLLQKMVNWLIKCTFVLNYMFYFSPILYKFDVFFS